MKVKRMITKPLSYLLSFMIVFSVVPNFGVKTAEAASIAAGDYVYLGTWNGQKIKWRVLNPSTSEFGSTGILLMSEYVLGDYFTFSDSSQVWEGSNAEKWCNEFYNGGVSSSSSYITDGYGLSATERSYVLSAEKTESARSTTFLNASGNEYTYNWATCTMKSDKVFFLSAPEVLTYLGKAADKHIGYNVSSTSAARYWWLRSPHAVNSNGVGYVNSYGRVNWSYYNDTHGARPALLLNPNISISKISDKEWEISTATKPSTPSSLSLSQTGTGTLAASWSAPSNGGSAITSYSVELYKSDGTKVASATPSSTSYTFTGVSPSTTYYFKVAATNSVGTGSYATSGNVKTWGVPNAPTGVTATAGNGQLAVSWTAPSSDRSITNYEISYTGGGSTKTVTTGSSATSKTITGLTNGTAYTVKVRAYSEVGWGSYSGSVSATPRTVPNAPSGVTVTPGNGQLTVSWTAPSSNGGSAISSYSIKYGNQTKTGISASATSYTITGLTNGTSYAVQVMAVNAAGTGSASTSVSGTPRTVPNAPSGVTATATGGTTATVSWTAPSNGGSAITGYTIGGLPSGASASVSGTTATITGLTKGTAYTFTVTAKNAAGSGSSASANSITTWKEPNAPSGVTATVTSGTTATVTWTKPSNNGSTITKYVISGGEKDVEVTGENSTSVNITGLTKGKAYTFTVKAVNSVGTSSGGTSLTITMWKNPGDVTNVSAAVTSSSSVSLSWTAPSDTGNTNLSGYDVTVSPSAGSVAVSGTSATVTGLSEGVRYTFTVKAKNSVGTSAGVDVATTTWARPSAPSGVTAKVLSGTSVKLTWSAAADNGQNITDYVVTGYPSGARVEYSTDKLSATITGLAGNTDYTFGVSAVNSVGTGSAATVGVKTLTNPTAPTVSVTPMNKSVKVDITAPSDNGGVDIKEYVVHYSKADGSEHMSKYVTSNTVTIDNLENGTEYKVWATAKNNSNLESIASSEMSVVPRTVPNAPGDVSAKVTGKTSVELGWSVPYDGGNAISEYVIEMKSGSGVWSTCKTVSANTAEAALRSLTVGVVNENVRAMNKMSEVIDGLDANTEYTFRIKAVNEAGGSEFTESTAVKTWIEPDMPTGVTVKSGDESGVLELKWQKPFDGNTEILGYKLYINDIARDDLIAADVTEYAITGLTDGEMYKIRLAAVNAAGEGAKSAELTGRPRRISDAPTITEIKAGNKQAFISIKAPADNGGANITEYRVYVNGEYNRSVDVKEVTDIAINDLKNNVTYSIAVTAVNAAGESVKSEAKSVKAGMPRPPENINVVPGNCEFSVSYTEAESNGNVITGYNVYVDGVRMATVDGNVLQTVVAGLINGMKYNVQVSTLSAAGESLLSDTVSVFVGGPTAPIITNVDVGDTSVTISWTDSETHGLLMKTYNVYVNGEKKVTTLANVKTATITGLTKGEEYAIEVAGENIAGEGEKSAPYTIVVGGPDAPETVTVTGGDSSLAVRWTAADGNGSDVTEYRIYLNGELYKTVGAADLTATLDGLANGVTYKVSVAGVNEYGEGFMSEVVSGVPYTNSHAPTNVVATATGSTSATLSWIAPLNDGGNAISGYEIGGCDGAEVVVTGTSATISNLEPNTEYTFTVAAKNAAGVSPNAGVSNAIVTWTTPDAPIVTKLEAGNGSANVTWTAPQNIGGSEIISYNVYVNGVKNNKTPITAENYSISNLTNGKFYTVSVSAVNAVGEGAKTEAQTVCAGIPTIPVITSVEAGDSAATITWTQSRENAYEITGYKLYIDGKPEVVIGDGSQYVIEGLENGRTYTIALTAMCGKGETAMSNSVTVTPGTLAAPKNIKAEPATAAVNVVWDAVAGAESYVVYVDGAEVKTEAGTSCVITGLENREYKIAVATKNTHGVGNVSEAVAVTPWTVPNAPSITSIVSTVDGFTVKFTEPKSNGKAIKYYEIYANGEKVTESDTLSATVTGLTSGELYSVTIKAISDAGASAESAATNIRIGAPGVTEVTSVDIGDGELTVHYSEAAQNGGAITKYNIYLDVAKQEGITAYANDTISVSSTDTSAKVTGLTNGVNYAITVEAVNSVGTGPLSEPYYAVPGAPSAPIMSSAIAGNGKVSLAWKKPLEGGDTVTKYRVYINDVFYAESTSLTFEVGDLTNGTEYSFSVSAVNANGESAKSDVMSAMPCTSPSVPQNIEAVALGEGTVKITWTEPSNNGGMPITGYIVTGDGTIKLNENELSAEVSGLVAGKTYKFAVKAVNDCGEGDVGTSNEVTTLTVPGKPSILLLEAGDGLITVAEWEEPENDGGSDILGYNVYYKEGKLGELVKANGEKLVTELPYSIEGLSNGVTYYVYIEAVNKVGRSEKSSASGARPAGGVMTTVSSAPQNLQAVGGDKTVTLNWSKPVFDGNTPITGYNVYVNGTKYTNGTIDDMEYSIDGLSNGTEYRFSVSAVNAVGEGDKTEEVTAIPEAEAVVTVPGAIDNSSFTFTVDKSQENAVLVWGIPTSDGGAEIEGYHIYVDNVLLDTVTGTTFTLPVEFEKTYAVAVAAFNSVGEGAKTRNIAVAYNLNIDTDDDGRADINVDTNNDGRADINIDTDSDGVPDINIDSTGDGRADTNIDTDGDNKPNINIKNDDGDIINKDTDGDGKADINIDTDGDGKADINIDTDGDGEADINIDTDGDGKPNINIKNEDGDIINRDTDGDGRADINIDTDGDGNADINIDTDGDGNADINVDTNGDGRADINIDSTGDGNADTNIDNDGDGKIDDPTTVNPDYQEPTVDKELENGDVINKDTDNDGKPDIDIDTDGDDVPDINIDTDGDGIPDINIDTNGDGKPDLNIDTDGDGKPDINVDTDGDGRADINIDTDGDGEADINIDSTGDGKPDTNIDSDGDGIPDSVVGDTPNTPNENAPTAPIIMGTVSDGLSTIRVNWTADNADSESVTGYNVYVNGSEVSTGQTNLYYDILNADSVSEYEVWVTAVNADGESDTSNVWTAKLLLNIDSNGDGEPDKSLDENGDGEADDLEDKTVKISGTVGFTGTSFKADVKLVNSGGITVATTTAANGEAFEIPITIEAGNVDNEVYSIVVSGKNSTVTTVTDITLGDVDIDLGKVTIYAGDVNGDGMVNIRDVGMVRTAYGKLNSNCDVNGDGQVNIRDVGIVRTGYGKADTTTSFNKMKSLLSITF